MRKSALMPLCLLAVTYSAQAVVLHDDSQPDLRPVDGLMGRWSTNASCVAIGPDLVITTMHQLGGVGSTVRVGGETYTAAEIYEYDGADSDLRVVRLADGGEAAQLGYWTQPYYGNTVGMEYVMGGYGRSRGSELVGSSGIYGYEWLGESNTTLRWGTNVVDRLDSSNNMLVADFDGPEAAGVTQYESAVAGYDSGGGWFVLIDGDWRVAGLSVAAEHAASELSIFATAQGKLDPDRLYGLDLSVFSTWLDETLGQLLPVTGDIDRDGDVDQLDLAAFATCYGADAGAGWAMGNFDGDGDVDLVDLGLLSVWYGYGVEAGGASLNFQADLAAVMLPEPACAMLILASLPGILSLRKRHR